MERPEILVFFSDQHDGRIIHGAGDPVVRTPNLDCLIREGVVFNSAYTSFPLCVPARMSCLTGQLPSHTGITTNACVVPEDKATFVHSLAINGYDTVLCGRMHFEGLDQRHGFTRRFVGDQTPVLWHRTGIDAERGPAFDGTYGAGGCTRMIGYGNSPVLEYDRIVAQRAVGHLAEDHAAPQAMVVGTYGPHFPYVAPRELYEYYFDRIEIEDAEEEDGHPIDRRYRKSDPPERIRQARAAYYAMIEEIDGHVGRVKSAFDDYCRRNGKPGLFIYMSDHGDMNGQRGQFGKQLFYEGSSRIPLIISGVNAKAGSAVETPVSIMDIGPTLCAMTGSAPPPSQHGMNLEALLAGAEDPDRHVISESVNEDTEGHLHAGRMVRRKNLKLISYAGLEAHDRLYDLRRDPGERRNLIAQKPDEYASMKRLLAEGWEPERMERVHREKIAQHALIGKWWDMHHPEDDERWRVTLEARSDLTQV